jgi:hypothetical protein
MSEASQSSIDISYTVFIYCTSIKGGNMPRNSDEAVEWPDEAVPDLAEVIRRLDLETQDEELVTPDLTDNFPPKD